jgi:hypothetical protein
MLQRQRVRRIDVVAALALDYCWTGLGLDWTGLPAAVFPTPLQVTKRPELPSSFSFRFLVARSTSPLPSLFLLWNAVQIIPSDQNVSRTYITISRVETLSADATGSYVE